MNACPLSARHVPHAARQPLFPFGSGIEIHRFCSYFKNVRKPVWAAVTDGFSIETEGEMMFRSMFPRDIFAELDRLQNEVQQAFDTGFGIRGGMGTFPAMNVGGTPQAVEVYAFAPGLDPASLEVNLERGVLTIAGRRESELPPRDEKSTVHINERFAGRFRRVISLPEEDIDPEQIKADYHDGVLHVSARRRESSQPRRIAIQ